MPNVDAGTYFFTALVPICNDGIVEHDGIKSSPVHVLREVLETLPTALQSHATQDIGIQSPFARNLRTHFARFVVLDQPYFNGRDHSDALVNAIRNTDLLEAKPVDEMTCPYLLVMIDFDCAVATPEEPRAYLQELWADMEPALRSIFLYSYGFSKVQDAAGFASFMIDRQVETTMPFHDYWYDPPALPSLSAWLLAAFPVAGVLLPIIAALLHKTSWGMAILLAVLLLIVGLFISYTIVMRRGVKAFPANPETSLRHVLKALYLQQAFTRFAMAQQHRDPGQWGPAFRAFLKTQAPNNLDSPTQPPGVIRSQLREDAA